MKNKIILSLLVLVNTLYSEETVDINAFLDRIKAPTPKEVMCKDVVKNKTQYIQCLEEITANNPTIKNINFLAGVYVVKRKFKKALKTYKVSMDKRDKEARYYYASIINEQLKEHKKALPYFETIKNYKDSTCQIGGIHSVPDKTDWREFYYKYMAEKRALAFYDAEIKSGNTKAYGCKALYYEKLEEYTKAKEMINKAIELDDDKGLAYFQMGQHYDQYDYNRDMRIKYYIKATNEGYATAAHNLGVDYALAREYKKSFPWFIKAHKLGFKGSLYDLAHAIDLDKQFLLAEKAYAKTALSGDDRGYYTVGIMYRTHKMYKKAKEKFFECINEGHSECATSLGMFYDEDIPMKDIDKAMYWSKKGYEMGDIEAASNIGLLYDENFKDYENAKKWYQIAVDAGLGQAAYNMARMYHKSIGNYKMADVWYKKSAELGFQKGIEVVKLRKIK